MKKGGGEKDYFRSVGLVQNFRAYNKKQNKTCLNNSDNYLLTSIRELLLRLWDMRRLPNEKETEKK